MTLEVDPNGMGYIYGPGRTLTTPNSIPPLTGIRTLEVKPGDDEDKFFADIPLSKPVVKTKYKYQEDEIIKEVSSYIEDVYKGHHYKATDIIECFDAWIALGAATTTARDTAIKYLWRVFKKGDEKDYQRDLIKTIHYCMFMLYLEKNKKGE